MSEGKIDWEGLCETPFVKLGHRIAAMLLVPIMLAVGFAFIEMRDIIKTVPTEFKRVDDRLNDHEQRMRTLEFGPSTRPWAN